MLLPMILRNASQHATPVTKTLPFSAYIEDGGEIFVEGPVLHDPSVRVWIEVPPGACFHEPSEESEVWVLVHGLHLVEVGDVRGFLRVPAHRGTQLVRAHSTKQ